MKIITIVLVLIVVAAVSTVVYLRYQMGNTIDNKNLEAAIDSEAKKFINSRISQGLVIGIYKDGKSFIKGYGTVDRESTVVPVSTTSFQIASVSKIFTASLLQILCDEGIINMDTTLGELIGSSISLSSAAQQVTLKQLVTHTSGFPSVPKPLLAKIIKLVGEENLMLDPYSHLDPQFIFDYLRTTEDKLKPGRFKYSNFGMGLLGHILENATGRDFESLVAEKVLVPLDMRGTGITLTQEMEDQLARGYTAKGELAPMWTFSSLAGAGAFNSNVEDMMRFIRANIEDDSSNSQSFKKMHVPQFDGVTGIGWMQPTFLDKVFGNRKIIWHNGMVGGYASYVSIDLDAKIGTVVLMNKAIDITMLGMMLTRQVRTQSWAPQHAF
jgi:CubicO group peptidase (beta-lactamase class C family)